MSSGYEGPTPSTRHPRSDDKIRATRAAVLSRHEAFAAELQRIHTAPQQADDGTWWIDDGVGVETFDSREQAEMHGLGCALGDAMRRAADRDALSRQVQTITEERDRLLEIYEPQCICAHVDIGVGMQKVDDDRSCPCCWPEARLEYEHAKYEAARADAAEAARGDALADAATARAQLDAITQAVEKLHAPHEVWKSPFSDERGLECKYCRADDWPCPTVAAVRAAVPKEEQR